MLSIQVYRMSRRALTALCALLLFLANGGAGTAQQRLGRITTPETELGFEIGADYRLADYTQLMAYWAKLARESDRMVLDTIGQSEEGRPQLMAIITAPENHRRLARHREIARRLARAEPTTEEEAWELASEGKAVVWIDGGLHADEVLGAQQLMQLVYDMVSLTDSETLRFLSNVILLAVHANPDGMELVSDWYMREPDSLARTTSGFPVLDQKYAGHDNNRDFFMANLAETENMNRVAYTEWFPQIVYNHHQTGPEGTVMFSPPFRDPPNYNIHPLVLTSVEQVGGHMHARFVREGKGGVTTRSGAELLHLVERRPADHALFPQHDRAAHRDHRAPDTHAGTLPPGEAASLARSAHAGRARGVEVQVVGRLLADGESRGPGFRLAES